MNKRTTKGVAINIAKINALECLNLFFYNLFLIWIVNSDFKWNTLIDLSLFMKKMLYIRNYKRNVLIIRAFNVVLVIVATWFLMVCYRPTVKYKWITNMLFLKRSSTKILKIVLISTFVRKYLTKIPTLKLMLTRPLIFQKLTLNFRNSILTY